MAQYRLSISDSNAATLKDLGDGNMSLGLAVHMKIAQNAPQPTRTTWQAATPDPDQERPADPRNPTGHRGIQNKLDREDKKKQEEAEFKFMADKEFLRGEFIYAGDWERMRKAGGFQDEKIPEIYHHPEGTLFSPEEMVEMRRLHAESRALERSIIARADRNTAETKRLREAGLPDTRRAPVVQTLKLSTEAQQRLGLFGTPADMTDEQIAETNAAYATPAPEPEKAQANWLDLDD